LYQITGKQHEMIIVLQDYRMWTLRLLAEENFFKHI